MNRLHIRYLIIAVIVTGITAVAVAGFIISLFSAATGAAFIAGWWTNLAAAYLGNPVLATLEQQDLAITAFERALECDPATPNVAYNIGLIYRDRDDRDRAIYWFTRALQADPLDRDARRILERLQKASRT